VLPVINSILSKYTHSQKRWFLLLHCIVDVDVSVPQETCVSNLNILRYPASELQALSLEAYLLRILYKNCYQLIYSCVIYFSSLLFTSVAFIVTLRLSTANIVRLSIYVSTGRYE